MGKKRKDPLAVELGRRGGKKGGKTVTPARLEALEKAREALRRKREEAKRRQAHHKSPS
jgi:molybdenum-dependent DNA-binding transcriptional regulator ModE